MKLKQAIQQDKFSNENQELTLNFIYTYNYFKDKLKTFLKSYGITSQQFNVLRILRGQYPAPYSTSEIRDRMLDKMSDASRIVERLVNKGLVSRKVTKSDRRLVDVVISEQGLALLKKIDKPLDELMESTFGDFTKKEKSSFITLMEKIRKD